MIKFQIKQMKVSQLKKSIIYKIILTILIILTTGCKSSVNNTQPIIKTDFYFDTVISITLYEPDKAYLIDECFKLCEKYENLFSKTITDSDISSINSANGQTVKIDKDSFELLTKGVYYSRLTKGNFDITIGTLSELWNFKNQTIPTDENIKKSLKNVDYRFIDLQNNTIQISNENTMLDVGGIAKGYVADKLKEYLVEHGVKNAIIDLGGNVLLIGSKPDNSYFNIGIAKPFAENSDTIAIVRTNDKSIVTSGNYQRYFYKEDKFYHHILNPQTGYPVDNELTSVTIISDKSIDGDALSTSCFVLGIEEGLRLIESIDGIEVIFIDKNNTITLSSGLSQKNNVIVLNN